MVPYLQDLFEAHFIELVVQRQNLYLGLEIDLIIVRGIHTVSCRLTILRHHNHGRLEGSKH